MFVKKLIVVCMLLHASITIFAQGIWELTAKADSLKSLYGEKDSRYLGAFTDVIQYLYDTKEYEKAYGLRKIHCDIVCDEYGKDSYEYAEDMFRLGNVAMHVKGEQVALECYLESLKAFEASGTAGSEYYGFCLFQITNCYQMQSDFGHALYYSKKYISVR